MSPCRCYWQAPRASSVPLGLPHPAPSGSGVSQCGPGLGRGDPAAAPEVPGKAWSGGACLTRAREEVREQGPGPAPGPGPGCSRLCAAGLSGLHLLPFQERVSRLCRTRGPRPRSLGPEGGQLEEPARAWGMLTVQGMAPGPPAAQVFGRTSLSGSPSPGWAVATVLLGEDDSGDLGQRPGQPPGERGAWREIHTPLPACTQEHTQAQGPLMSPLLSLHSGAGTQTLP